jgi:hypothetical protein
MLRLDVYIESLDIEWDKKPKQSDIGIELQYQSHCLDVNKIVDRIARWNV